MTSTISNNIGEIKHLNKEIEDTQKEVIFTMGAIGETRSKETGNHVKRVAEYSRILALKYGLDQDIANLLKEASPMHDIGKVGIPDKILNKPGKLTDDEYLIMKKHTLYGYDILKDGDSELSKVASVIALEHHEKWDGSGYPNSKKGKEISIYSRITMVSDVFDALASERPYKKAWKIEDAMAELKRTSGSHFDPEIVELFEKNLNEIIKIKLEYHDD